MMAAARKRDEVLSFWFSHYACGLMLRNFSFGAEFFRMFISFYCTAIRGDLSYRKIMKRGKKLTGIFLFFIPMLVDT